MITLRKYKNRKIYDPRVQGYVNLSQVLLMANDCTPFRVLCANTETDITGMVVANAVAYGIMDAARKKSGYSTKEVA